MSTLLIVFIGIVWLLAMLTVYRMVRDLGSNEAFGDFVCALLFWWIILPLWAIALGTKMGWVYGELRAGTETGLYD